jgi:hypothetical protein
MVRRAQLILLLFLLRPKQKTNRNRHCKTDPKKQLRDSNLRQNPQQNKETGARRQKKEMGKIYIHHKTPQELQRILQTTT